MKTLAYEVVFRLENTIHEQIINNGFIVVYFNEEDNFKFLEGLLTNDYMYGKLENDKWILNLYSSYILQELYSRNDAMKLTEELVNQMEISWQGIMGIDELEFPFEINLELEYPINNGKELVKEKVNIACGRPLSDVEKYKSLIEYFKNNKVFVSL